MGKLEKESEWRERGHGVVEKRGRNKKGGRECEGDNKSYV